MQNQTEYDFTLVVSPTLELNDAFMEAIHEAGCDDANVSLRDGVMRLAFTRSATSLRDAITSAIMDVNRSGINATVSSIENCDSVGDLRLLTTQSSL